MKTILDANPCGVVQIENEYFIVNSSGSWWMETKHLSKFENIKDAVNFAEAINYQHRLKKLTSF